MMRAVKTKTFTYSVREKLMVAGKKLTTSTPLSCWLNGLFGVVIFSGSLPATRVAVRAIDPFFLTFTRASIAGVLALFLVIGLREKRPATSQIFSLSIVSFGVIIGFPLLSAMALQHETSAHSMVYLGLLPLITAIFGVIRGGERLPVAFWIFSCTGSLLVVGFALTQNVSLSFTGDILMLTAVAVCGLGYAEGARLSRELGGWPVIGWALVGSLPLMLIASFITLPPALNNVGLPAWIALGYVSLFSMLIGFIFWYKALAKGGIATVSQLQLLQPFSGLAFSALFLHETVGSLTVATTFGVILCVAGSRKFAR